MADENQAVQEAAVENRLDTAHQRMDAVMARKHDLVDFRTSFEEALLEVLRATHLEIRAE